MLQKHDNSDIFGNETFMYYGKLALVEAHATML